MTEPISLAAKLALLFEYGQDKGLPTTYRAIAEATKENANNIRKIYVGENENPGLRTLSALAEYFQVGLAYFDCNSREECEAYLEGATARHLTETIALRTRGISESGLEAIKNMIDYVRNVERLPPEE